MKKLFVGQIVNVVGLKGEVKVHSDSENLQKGTKVLLEEKEYLIENARYQKGMVILKLEGISDRNAAESLRGKKLYISEDELKELPDDTFYIKDLAGLTALNALDGKEFGKVKDVMTGASQDIFVIELLNGKEAMVPGVKEFLKEINPAEGYVKIKPIKGLIDADFLEIAKDDLQ